MLIVGPLTRSEMVTILPTDAYWQHPAYMPRGSDSGCIQLYTTQIYILHKCQAADYMAA